MVSYAASAFEGLSVSRWGISAGSPDLFSLNYSRKLGARNFLGIQLGLLFLPGLNLLVKDMDVDFSSDFKYLISPKFGSVSSGVYWEWYPTDSEFYIRWQASMLVVQAGGKVFLKNTQTAKSVEVAQISVTAFQPCFSVMGVIPFSNDAKGRWEAALGVSFLPRLSLLGETSGSFIGYMDVSPQSADTLGRGLQALEQDLSQTVSNSYIPVLFPAVLLRLFSLKGG